MSLPKSTDTNNLREITHEPIVLELTALYSVIKIKMSSKFCD